MRVECSRYKVHLLINHALPAMYRCSALAGKWGSGAGEAIDRENRDGLNESSRVCHGEELVSFIM